MTTLGHITKVLRKELGWIYQLVDFAAVMSKSKGWYLIYCSEKWRSGLGGYRLRVAIGLAYIFHHKKKIISGGAIMLPGDDKQTQPYAAPG